MATKSTMTLLSLLFDNSKEPISCTGTKTCYVGKPTIKGVTISEARKKAHPGKLEGPAISTAAKFLDYLLMEPGNVAMYPSTESTEQTCVFLNKKHIVVNAATKEIKTTKDITAPEATSALVAHALCDFSTTSGFWNEFASAVETYSDKALVPETAVMLFSDALYFSIFGDRVGVDEWTISRLDENEVEAAFREGLYGAQALSENEVVKKFLGKSPYDGASGGSASASTTKATPNSFFQDCLDGKYVLPVEWDREVAKYVRKPKALETYVPDEKFEHLVKHAYRKLTKVLERLDSGLAGADAIGKLPANFLATGVPGTGKTATFYALAAALGMPAITVSLNKGTDEGEFMGKTVIKDGRPEFVETEYVKGMKHGALIILEEANLPDPSVIMGCVGQVLDFPYVGVCNGTERMERNPLTIMALTWNPDTSGSNNVNEALLNRLSGDAIHFPDPSKDKIVDILVQSTDADRKVCEWAYSVYEKVTEYLESPSVGEPELCDAISLRTLKGMVEAIMFGDSPDDAAEYTIYGTLAAIRGAAETAERVKDEVLSILPAPGWA